MLKALDHVSIPKAAETLGFLKVAVRCETSELQCLRLDGLVGAPASTFYFGNLAAITLVCEKVMDALDHARSREIVHLDVCPSNIIVLQEMDGSMQVQLVDWVAPRPHGHSRVFEASASLPMKTCLVSRTVKAGLQWQNMIWLHLCTQWQISYSSRKAL